jgi:hypothetical protein
MRLCRVDRQKVEGRAIVLHWLICESCKHVQLGQWEWDGEWDDVVIEEVPAPEEDDRIIHLPRFGRNRRDGRSS